MAICLRLLSAIAEVKLEDLVLLDPTVPSDGGDLELRAARRRGQLDLPSLARPDGADGSLRRRRPRAEGREKALTGGRANPRPRSANPRSSATEVESIQVSSTHLLLSLCP